MPQKPDPIEEIYIDETSQTGHRFLILGGITIPQSLFRLFEADIIEARKPHLEVRFDRNMQLKEIGWKEVGKGDFEAYKKVVDAYFSFGQRRLQSSLDSVEFHCSVVDTHIRGRRYAGKDGQLGFNREIYFHCMSIARRHGTKEFHVYPDDRSTTIPIEHSRETLCRGLRKEEPHRSNAFRKVQPRFSHECQALQVSDLFIGAVAYRLNRHYEAADANPDKKALCEYILTKGMFWKHVKSTSWSPREFGRFQVWFRRHKS